MEKLLDHHPIDEIRHEANRQLDPARKSALGQFMTPSQVGHFMASLFQRWDLNEVRLLDAGAGIGSLSAAFWDIWFAKAPKNASGISYAYEIDEIMRRHLNKTLTAYENRAHLSGRVLCGKAVAGDFIEQATANLLPLWGNGERYTHAILNPPYKKMGSASKHRLMLREVGIETVNLYTAFVATTIALMDQGGELVAIVPRSWCNGTYYRPFRQWMLRHAALTHLHLFESRTKAFKDDEVLQENVIVRWVRGAPQGEVVVSSCTDATFSDLRHKAWPFHAIVKPRDPEAYVHIPLGMGAADMGTSPLSTCSLGEIGIEVSTGPVVDFRLKGHLRKDAGASTVPLLYPQHFQTGALRYPSEGRKPNGIVHNDETERWLFPRGWYVITKRFSAKEERRRLVAHVIDPAKLPGDWVGFENHVNVFHSGKSGIDADLAHGLALFLNSTVVDEHFRVFSGHTQVNATDLRGMRYPPRDLLMGFGRWARAQVSLDQSIIDQYIEQYA